jgi:phytoene synthase
MSERVLDSIFKKGSTTFFYSSKFFPSDVKRDVTKLYAFVRTADDYVDSIPQQAEAFYSFKERYHAALEGTPADDEVIDSFVELQQRMGFDQSWIDAFFDSMEMDISKEHYSTMEEVETYLYGSAEVVGLMMARIMRLPPRRTYRHATSVARTSTSTSYVTSTRISGSNDAIFPKAT